MNLDQREARWLLQEKYHGVLSDAYEQDLIKLQSGVPLAYLIGHIPFLDCHIDLSYKPLIPRAETEYWTDLLIKQINSGRTAVKINILDICAGSGCIGIAIMKHVPQSHVTFADIDPDCIKQIQKNCELNNIDPAHYQIIQSDLFNNLEIGSSNYPIFEYVISNPPYIAQDRCDTVQDSVHDNENHTALYTDDDGLLVIKQLIEAGPQSSEYWVEFDPWQIPLLEKYLKEKSLQYEFIKDQFDKKRVLKLSN